MGFVSDEGEHDEISIKTVHAVASVGWVGGCQLCPADVLHDLVFALSRHLMPGEDDGQLGPQRVLLHALPDKESDVLAQPHHKRCAGGDTIGVKWGCGAGISGALSLEPLCCLQGGFEAP